MIGAYLEIARRMTGRAFVEGLIGWAVIAALLCAALVAGADAGAGSKQELEAQESAARKNA